ncbi:MAG: OmpA family protein [Victivallales bacterium]|nr:OmpA family protein [Victivallales bacterium]
METKRSFLMVLAVSLSLLFAGTGCQMVSDLFGMGGGDQKDPETLLVPDDDLPDTSWSAPDEGVTPSPDEWTPRTDIKFPSVYFSYDKFLLGAREKSILDQVATYMKAHETLGLIVEGHCDERGSDEYNRSLGERRALSVKEYLSAAGISAERVKTLSYGEERPAVKGADESAFLKNRRADLIPADMK